jgi:hypothetical protein
MTYITSTAIDKEDGWVGSEAIDFRRINTSMAYIFPVSMDGNGAILRWLVAE